MKEFFQGRGNPSFFFGRMLRSSHWQCGVSQALFELQSFILVSTPEETTSTAAFESSAVVTDPRDRRRQTWLRFAASAGLGSFFLSLTAINFVDPDIWHEMALIRESLRVGHLLTRDIFAYVPTVYPCIHHEWGAGLLAYALTHWFGSHAILIVKYVVAFSIAAISLRCAKSMGADARTWSILCPAAIYLVRLGFVTVIRAQVYSFFFAACCFWVFELDRRGYRTWLIAWICVFPIWVNLHGGFVVGIGLLALYIVERALDRQPIRHLLFLLGGTIIEVFINPFGPDYVRYIVRALGMARPHIQEWRPAWAYGFLWMAVFLAAIAIAAYGVAKPGVRRAPGVLMLIAAGVEATLHCKLMPLFAIAWISLVPAYLQRTPVGPWLMRFHQRRLAFVLSTWLFVTAVFFIDAVRWQFWRMRVAQISTTYAYPVGAVEYLGAQGFAGNLMVPFTQGAYVSWKLFPAVRVSLDSRYEVAYSEEWVDRSFRFYAAEPGWQETLRAYPTDLVLVPKITPLARVMPESGWRRAYVDREFELYARPGLALPFSDRTSQSFDGVFP